MAKEPAPEEPGVEVFTFPPQRFQDLPYDLIKTNEVQPHDRHIKDLLTGLEKLLRGKFAASDHQAWFAGSYVVRQDIGLDH